MARRYVRDAKGRFAGKGFSGQTGGRGARLKSGKGNTRDTGGARATVGTGKPKGTISGTKVGRSSDSAERMIKRDIAAKKKSKSEGQKYADKQAQSEAARKAETTKRLEAFNKRTQARLDTQTKPPTSNAREAATNRLKIKTATRRKLKTDRSSVVPANPTARRVQGVRPGSTVARAPRAKGNAPATVANRVSRKAAVNKANLKIGRAHV